ncbi:MAG: copper transporter [Aquihabitans sp.]
MINLRYHIVSITAVFLALGIGVALGGTFLDKYTVDVLDKNIRSAEERIRGTNAENARLEREVAEARARDESLIRVGGTDLFADHLTEVPMVIITASDVSADVLSNLRLSLDQSGADLRGTLELRDALAFTDGVPEDLAALVDVDPTDKDAAEAVTDALRTALLEAGAPADVPDDPDVPGDPDGSDDTGTTSTSTSTTTTTAPIVDGSTTTTLLPGEKPDDVVPSGPDGQQPEIFTALVAADYLRFTPGPGFTADDPLLEQTGYRYIFVSGPEVDALGNDLLMKFLPSGPPASILPAVVVSASVPTTGDDEDRAPTAVARVRADNDLTRVYSTVDDVETFSGLVSTVLVAEDLGTVEVGHYGQSRGATSILPPAT